MTLPDKVADGVQHEFSWDEDPSTTTAPKHHSIRAQFVQGTTIVFDSFSSEQDVKRRNQAAINISKIGDASRRFATDFTVRASGEVTAVLSAGTVASYRVVDTKRGQQAPTPAPPSFSSIIINGAAPISQTDGQLAASLAACASPSIASSGKRGGQSDARTEHLRKRCKTMLHQRSAHHHPGEGEETPSKCMVTRGRSHSVDLNRLAPTGVTFAPAAVPVDSPGFFMPVLRPIAVQQAMHKYDANRKADATGIAVVGGDGCAGPAARGRAATNNTLQQSSDGMGDGLRPSLSAAVPSSSGTAFAATTASLPPSAVAMCAVARAAAVMPQPQSAFSMFNARTLLPPLLSFPAQSDSHRLSSSDLVLATMECPVPVDGLMNLSDIRFHRSSDDMVALSAAW